MSQLASLVYIFFYYYFVKDEWLNPSEYDIDGTTALASLKKCYTCGSLGGLMEYCDRCSSTTKSG